MNSIGKFAISLVGIILIGVIFTGFWSRQNTKSNQTMTIGAVLPLSGQNEFYGNEIRNAIELARMEINDSGGLNGRNLDVIFEDDQADPKMGVSAFQKLIDLDKVPVILGPWASGVVVAAAPIAEKNKVIVMAEALAPAISDAGDYVFRIQPSAVFYTAELAKQSINKLNLHKFALIYINNEFGVSLLKTFKQEILKAGGNILTEESYRQGDQDFRSQLAKIKSTRPDAVFIAGYQEQFSIIKQASELNLKTTFLAGPTFENRKAVDDLGSLAENVIYAHHFVLNPNNSKAQTYAINYKNKFGVETGGYAPLMYDAVYIIADALRQCLTDTKCIKSALYKTNYEGVSGQIVFDTNGDPQVPIVIKTVKNGQFIELR